MTCSLCRSSEGLQEAKPTILSHYRVKCTEEEMQEQADEKGITTLHRTWRQSHTCPCCEWEMGMGKCNGKCNLFFVVSTVESLF